MKSFTLNDALFIDALLAGIEGANKVVPALDVYLVGGGAIQYYASETPEFRRPTVDVDIQSRIYVPQSIRSQWGRNVEAQLLERRRKGVYNTAKTKTGAEVTVETGDNSPFFIHLDLFRTRYIEEHKTIIEGSFERKRHLDLRGRRPDHAYFVQAPEDISYHKLKRLITAVGSGRLSPEDERCVALLAQGLLDDVEVGDLTLLQEKLGQMRNMGLEEVTRQGFEGVADIYNVFRDQKSLYDLRLLVASHRYRPIFTDPRIIRQNIEQDESIHARAKDKGIFK